MRRLVFLLFCACGRTSPYELVSAPPSTMPTDMPCPVGDVSGAVCAPDGKTLLNGAQVTVDGVDCRGMSVHLETVSGADGAFTVRSAPAGIVRINATLGDFTQHAQLNVIAGKLNELPASNLCLAQQQLKIAVVTGSGDKIERLLQELGLTFTVFDGTRTGWTNHAAPFLADLTRLKTYDLVFIDCAAASSSYVIDFGDEAQLIESNLEAYVKGGGSLYASDWGALFLAFAAPDALPLVSDVPLSMPFDAHHLAGFAPATVTARVTDPGLSTFLGKSSLSINFPKQGSAVSLHWGLLQPAAPGVTVLAMADGVETCASAACDAPGPTRDAVPLAVRVKLAPERQHGGQVLFTSFHNIAQSGDDVAKLLKYLVLNL